MSLLSTNFATCLHGVLFHHDGGASYSDPDGFVEWVMCSKELGEADRRLLWPPELPEEGLALGEMHEALLRGHLRSEIEEARGA